MSFVLNILHTSKPLADNLICHGHEDCYGSNIDDDCFSLIYEEVMFCQDHGGYMPESAHNRFNQHLGINESYADYISRYYSPVSSDVYNVQEPVIDTLDLNLILLEDNTDNPDVNIQNDVVYGANID